LSRSFNSSLASAFHKRRDFAYGCSQRRLGIADMATNSIANEVIALGNNRRGRELLRRGVGNNLADAIASDWSNGFVGKRWK
jgi:hypothetical protein